jgi:hypothetical protein
LILHTNTTNDLDDFRDAWSKYYRHLEAIRDYLPSDAYFFASADWHYDRSDGRCFCDSELIQIEFGTRGEEEIALHFLSAMHTHKLVIRYKEINSFSYHSNLHAHIAVGVDIKMVDQRVSLDEMRLGQKGFLLHEIAFLSGGSILIESKLFSAAFFR